MEQVLELPVAQKSCQDEPHANYRVQRFTSIDHVPHASWDAIAPRDHVCLETDHLRAIERSGINDIQPFYLTISADDGSLAGVAHFFLMDMDFSALGDSISPAVRESVKSWYPDFMVMKMLECGLIAGIGETIAARDGLLADILPAAIGEMEAVAREAKADIILLRDVPYHKFRLYHDYLKTRGYEPVLGYPTTIMTLPWASFDDYLSSLKSSTRYNIKSHLSRLESPEISVEVIDDFTEHSDQLAELINQLYKKTDVYEHERLNASYFHYINKCLSSRSFIITIKRYDKIIAYGLCLEGDNELLGVYCGVDREWNAQYHLYFNIYLLSIKEALKRGKKSISFGITNYEFKLIIGCELQPLVYFVKHCANPVLTPALARSLKDSLKQPENKHRPFNSPHLPLRSSARDLEKELENATKDRLHDVFGKAYSYTRTDILKLVRLYAFFPSFESAQSKYVQLEGKQVIMLGSNSYMGLGSHPKVCEAAKAAIDKYGTGCSGSPILNGTLDIHLDLAQALAKFMQKEDAVLYSTGYQTNLGVIAAIAGRHDVLVLDSLNHASIMDGAKFSYADVERFEHNDLSDLEAILRKHRGRNIFIVVDSVFSMEGTIADLPEIVRLAKQYGARIMLDEAHGIGVLGPGGRGAAEELGVLDEIDIVMGTFSKSFAGVGGFVASSARVTNYLRHVSRSHMFSASLPPPVVAAVRCALDIIINEPERRKKVLENARYMAAGLKSLGYQAEFNGTAVVPVYCCDELLTLALFNKLFEHGVYVNPVLSPAVPKGKELLRTSYMAIHDEETLARALQIFKKVRTPHFPRPGQDLTGGRAADYVLSAERQAI